MFKIPVAQQKKIRPTFEFYDNILLICNFKVLKKAQVKEFQAKIEAYKLPQNISFVLYNFQIKDKYKNSVF